MEPQRPINKGEKQALSDLNREIEDAVKKSKEGIRQLPVKHILPGCAHTLVDAFGSITFTPETSRKIAKLRHADPKLYGDTIGLIRKAHEIYAQGEKELQKIHDKLPPEAKDRYRAFMRGEAEWEEVHDACKKRGFDGVSELVDQTETHARRGEKAKKLAEVLEQAHADKSISDAVLRKNIENIFYPER